MAGEFALTKRQLLVWLQCQKYRFESYYKYMFTFVCTSKKVPFRLTVQVGGDAGDIYRFKVQRQPVDWSSLIGGGDRWITVWGQDEEELLSMDLDELLREAEKEEVSHTG